MTHTVNQTEVNGFGATALFGSDLLQRQTENLGGSFEVDLDSETAEHSGVSTVKCRIGKMYNSGGNVVYVLSYVDMSSTVRDDILRYLFKKQVEHKQKLKKARKN